MTLPNIINAILQQNMRKGLQGDFEDTMREAHSALDAKGQAVMAAVSRGDATAAQEFGGLISKEHGRRAGAYAKAVQTMQETTPPQQVTPTEPSRREPTIAVEPIEMGEPAPDQRRPWEFDNPLWEFWIPSMIGGRGTAASILLNRMEIDRKRQQIEKQQANDATWFRYYAYEKSQGTPHATALDNAVKRFGYIPSGASALEDLSQAQRSALFRRGMLEKMEDPSIIQRYSHLGPNAQARAISLTAFLGQVMETGYVPDSLEPLLNSLLGLTQPELKDDVEQELAAMGNAPPTPENIEAAIDRINARAVDQTGKEAYEKTKAVERATSEIYGGRGPLQRRAAEKAVDIRTGFQLETEKPVSAADRAKHGIGSDIPTYKEFADKGFRFPTEADRKLYQQLSAIRSSFLSSFKRTLPDGSTIDANTEDLLFGSDGIFSGIGNDAASRAKARLGLAADKLKGNQRGRNAELYDDLLASWARQLLVLAMESGGRFTDVDVRQIVQSAPGTGGLFELPDSEALARDKFNRFIQLLNDQLRRLTQTTAISPMGQPGISKDEWMEKARQANPNSTDKALSDYYDKKYGGQ